MLLKLFRLIYSLRLRSLAAAGTWLLVLGFSTTTNVSAQTSVRIMSANITSGNGQSYEAPGIRIFQGLKPDVVAIQEFRYQSSSSEMQLRQLVDIAFGTNFNFYCEPGYNIPNGIVSRWPIVNSGSLDSPEVNDRGYAWAQIDLPGTTNDLYVISVHLYGSGTATDRNTEAMVITNFIATNCPPNAWVVVAGDFNTGSRGEACVTTFKTILSDSPVPDDNGSPLHNTGEIPDADTNEPRNKPYDYVLPSFSLATFLTPVALPSHTLTNGLVFDSDIYTPLEDIAPVVFGDSHVNGMQHMAVIKEFLIPADSTEHIAPEISVQPQGQTVSIGSNVTFTVTATGTAPLSYKWFFGETNIANANAAAYTINSVQGTNAGTYSVLITNAYGSITSSPAVLIVTNFSPSIIAEPQSRVAIIGDSVTFNVVVSGTPPLNFQWRFNDVDILGATTNSYTLSNVQFTNAGNYSVVITNNTGSITSQVAVLTVNGITTGTNIVLVGWDVSGQSGYGLSPLPPTTNASNLTITGLTRGSGINTAGTAAARAWGGNGFDAVNASAAASANDFATFSIAVNANYRVSFTAISRFDYRRSSSGPPSGVLQYQVGGGGFVDIAALSFSSTASGGASLSAIDLSGISALQNVNPSNTVTFRIVNYGGASGGNWYLYDYANNIAPDLVVEGILNPISTPAAARAVLSAPVMLPDNRFQVTVTGTAGSNYIAQVSTNLAGTNWTPILTNPSPFTLTESNANTFPQKFYRAVTSP